MKIEAVPIPPPKKVISEKDFDLETWRKEVPIDYYVMARLLTVSDHPVVRTELFKTVYQAVQLHIPNTLYKYISLSGSATSDEKRFDALLKNRLFLSEVSSFNDPFDCRAYYYDPSALLKYEELKPYNGKIIDDFSSMVRVVSLTSNGVQSLPMWAHYANNHAGFCVSYDMTDRDNLSLKGCTFPVFYTDDRMDITSVMDSFINTVRTEINVQSAAGKKDILIDDLSIVFLASLLCNVKQSSWSYENEYRCTEGATAPGIPFVYAKAKKKYLLGFIARKSILSDFVKLEKYLGYLSTRWRLMNALRGINYLWNSSQSDCALLKFGKLPPYVCEIKNEVFTWRIQSFLMCLSHTQQIF